MTTAQNPAAVLREAAEAHLDDLVTGMAEGLYEHSDANRAEIRAIRQALGQAPASSRIETRATVVLSTEHLSAATINLLNASPLEAWPVAGGRMMWGYMLWAPEDIDTGAEVPSELAAALAWARASGFDYVLFDADADPLDHLPTFDHAAVVSPPPA
ncbi:hypothetical protein V7S57_02570 [Caulobacter sp. CCNWLY153]|uniref:DUF5983 family protein n=1 Tax=unclassified Caulobacter TaxID=2648921 RepID=UPI002FEF2631